MIPQCASCGSQDIEYIDTGTGEFVPDAVALLIEAITENFPRQKWKEPWTSLLINFHETEIESGTNPDLLMKVAKALGGYAKKYANYNLTYQNWVASEKERAPSNGRMPKRRGNY